LKEAQTLPAKDDSSWQSASLSAQYIIDEDYDIQRIYILRLALEGKK
jgi:hypothetical protein